MRKKLIKEYDEACSIAERNKFLWFMRDPVIFFDFIKFYLIKKLNIYFHSVGR